MKQEKVLIQKDVFMKFYGEKKSLYLKTAASAVGVEACFTGNEGYEPISR